MPANVLQNNIIYNVIRKEPDELLKRDDQKINHGEKRCLNADK